MEKTGAYGTTIVSINIADIFCAIPLFILWGADLFFVNPFIIKEVQWRSSILCHMSFATVIFFSLMSPLLLCFLSLSRVMVVIHPLDTNFKDTKFVLKYLTLFCAGCLFLACGLTIIQWALNSFIPNNLCSPFIDPTDSVIIVEVLTWVVVTVQTASSLLILITYVVLVISLQKSQKVFSKRHPESNRMLL